MSGGSHNYLCYASFPEIMKRTSDMLEVEKELIKLGYTDIAKDVRRLIEYCYTAENAINVLCENLEDVFHDVEWYCSADISKQEVVKRLEQYRKSGTSKRKSEGRE